MDILIAFLLVVVATGLFLKHPIQITIYHKYDAAKEMIAVPESPNDIKAVNLDGIIQTINEAMGVDTFEQDSE